MRRLMTVLAVLALCITPALAKKKKKRNKGDQAEQSQTANPDVHSSWIGTLQHFKPGTSANDLTNAYLLANLTELAYGDTDGTLRQWASAMGCSDTHIERKKGKAMILCGRDDVVIATVQGSGSNTRDLERACNADYRNKTLGGRVHEGGFNLSKELRGALESFLAKHPNKPVFLAGHSMGGLAALYMGAHMQRHLRRSPKAVFTFAVPRIGNREFRGNLDFAHYHYANHGDPVPLMYPDKFPPHNELQYFDKGGNLQRDEKPGKSAFNWVKEFGGAVDAVLKKGKTAHSMFVYVKNLRRNLSSAERDKLPEPKDF
ncbi:MAG: lipase family protein [Myxococcales bacterium]|nr:lipase family protein [Myxococcales bacterium]MCB9525997.1 lipase family protein [Myxococcales bacterium]